MTLEPVEITISGDHAYRNRGKGRNGCGHVFPNDTVCMKSMADPTHLSLPLSLNVVGSRGGHFTYKTFKAAWQTVLTDALIATGLPAGWTVNSTPATECIEAITVEALLCFPVARFARDQGNFRWFLEKCLGDALSTGGWLQDDSIYPVRRYEFGGLQIIHRAGESWTRLMLFPSLQPLEMVA